MRTRDTQAQIILRKLQEAGERGVTNIELNAICFRYGGRIFDLREGKIDQTRHNVETVNEGKGVFRFILHPPTVPEQIPLLEVRANG